MKLAFIITEHAVEKTDGKTVESIKLNDKEAVILRAIWSDEKNEETAINECIESVGEDITHACIIPDGSTLSEKYLGITSQYTKDEKTVYMPLVSYYYDPEGEKFKGFLNATLWKPHVAEELGVVDLKLSTKQADTTLYFSIIPVEVLKKFKFNIEMKFFSQFEYLNRIVKNEVTVLGIPKAVANLNKDYELKKEDKKEKIVWFEKAREGYNVRSFQELQALMNQKQ